LVNNIALKINIEDEALKFLKKLKAYKDCIIPKKPNKEIKRKMALLSSLNGKYNIYFFLKMHKKINKIFII
jgi:hypothetical protein